MNDLSRTLFTAEDKLHGVHLAWAVAGKNYGVSSHTLEFESHPTSVIK